MRKFLIPLMAASMLMPVAAHAEDGDFVRAIRERAAQRDSSSDDRSQRVQRDSSSADRPQRVQRMERIEQSAGGEPRVRTERDRPQRLERLERRIRQVETAEPVQQVETSEPVRVQRDERRDGLVGAIQDIGRDSHRRDRDTVRTGDSDNDRRGFGGFRDRIIENGDRVDTHRRWRSDWRRDHRYDWRSYRHRYGSLFRLGRYYDPYGWGYRRFSIGFSLWPNYYRTSRYWLHDPWMYRLPYAPPGYRWIRYYDDALLVDTWSGQVVDVIHNFFW